jgi:hypothetical protein
MNALRAVGVPPQEGPVNFGHDHQATEADAWHHQTATKAWYVTRSLGWSMSKAVAAVPPRLTPGTTRPPPKLGYVTRSLGWSMSKAVAAVPQRLTLATTIPLPKLGTPLARCVGQCPRQLRLCPTPGTPPDRYQSLGTSLARWVGNVQGSCGCATEADAWHHQTATKAWVRHSLARLVNVHGSCGCATEADAWHHQTATNAWVRRSLAGLVMSKAVAAVHTKPQRPTPSTPPDCYQSLGTSLARWVGCGCA